MGLKPSPSGFFIVGSNLSKDNKINTWHVSERTSVRSSRPKNYRLQPIIIQLLRKKFEKRMLELIQ
ncbi:MAG: hypothetical protein CMN21_09970 [Rubinisphaera sp.]|nr:hypothetical protein [Rubinisphaera sp.]